MTGDPDFQTRGPVRGLSRLLRVGLVLAFFGLIAAAPVMRIWLGPVKTVASIRPPSWSVREFAKGRLTPLVNQWLQESCRLVYQVRGVYNEALYRRGWLHDNGVEMRPDGWMFLRRTLNPVRSGFRRTQAIREAALTRVHRRAEALGIPVVVCVAPDRATIRPDRAYDSGEVPGPKRACYAEFQKQVRQIGFRTIDLRRPLRRAVEEGKDVVFRRDSHWNENGQTVAARVIRGHLGREYPDVLRPQLSVRLGPPREVSRVPGLVQMIGLRSNNRNGEEPSALVRELLEFENSVMPRYLADGRWKIFDGKNPDAPVCLVGTSFSSGLTPVLASVLRVDVNCEGVVPSGGPFGGIHGILDRVEKGELKPKVIIWEFVERQIHFPNLWRGGGGAE